MTGDYIIENEMDGNDVTITNTPSVTPSVTKHWLGVSDTQEVTVELYRKTAVNETPEQADTAVLTAATNWSYTFDPQPKYDPAGNAYEYWVVETLIGGQDAAQAAETGDTQFPMTVMQKVDSISIIISSKPFMSSRIGRMYRILRTGLRI